MSDAILRLPDDAANTGPKVDNESLTVGANTVYRQRVQVAGDSATDVAPVTAADGLTVNLGTNNDVTVTGTVAVSGTVPVSDGAGSLTVDGTVTAHAGTGPWPVTDNGGTLSIDDGAGSITIDGTVAVSGTTAVSAASLPLPSGASTEATLAAIDTKLGGTLTVTGGGGGVEYTEGDADATITGGAVLMEGAANTLVPLQGTVADGVLVNLGANNDVTVTGTVTANAGSGPWPVTDNGGSLTVDGTVAVSSLPALAAGTNNIGDVDVLSVPAPLSTTGGGTEAAALRVTLANDSTGVVSVDDNGASLTVDGTVAISGTVAVTDNASSLTIDSTQLPAALAANGGMKIEGVAGGVAVPISGSVTATVASTTVTGTVAVTQSGTWDEVGINDSGNSITVDAPVGTPAFVRLSDGAAAITTLPVSLATLPALVAGSANIGDVDILTIAAGDNNIGNVDIVTMPSVVLTTGSAVIGQVGLEPRTSGGLLISRVISAASTNATSAKASAGQVYGWYLSNINAAVRYLKLYNKASAPTVGTDTPVLTIAIPGNAAGAGANVEFTNGIAFATGIAYALTTGVADADTGAVAASEIVVNLLYK